MDDPVEDEEELLKKVLEQSLVDADKTSPTEG